MSETNAGPYRVEKSGENYWIKRDGWHALYAGDDETSAKLWEKNLNAAYAAGAASSADVLREVREAMAAIAQGAGPYNTDKLKHAENCIEAMKEIARAALAKLPKEAPPASSPRA